MNASENGLWADIQDRYLSAQENQAAHLTDTKTEIIQDEGFVYILKIASKLKDKPKAVSGTPKAWKNPFLPPDPALFVSKLSDTHALVLNKFNIVPYHVIIITNEFKKQEEPLDARDFEACRRVIQVWILCGALPLFLLAVTRG